MYIFLVGVIMKNEERINQLNILYKAFSLLENEKEAENFLFDLCTEGELSAMAQRLRVAEMLLEKAPYGEIEKETAASSATISRVSNYLNKKGSNGYKTLLERLKNV